MKRFNLFTIILLSLCFITLASAQDLGLKQVGGKLGVVFPKAWDTGFEIGATANMGELTDNLELFPVLSYWSFGAEVFSVDVSGSNFQVGADVHYLIENVEGLYVGGGLSLNFFSTEVGVFNPITQQTVTASGSTTEFGFAILGGYQMPIGDYTGFAEAKYNLISGFNTFEICVGILFDMD